MKIFIIVLFLAGVLFSFEIGQVKESKSIVDLDQLVKNLGAEKCRKVF